MSQEVHHKTGNARKTVDSHEYAERRGVCLRKKSCFHEEIAEPTRLYGCEIKECHTAETVKMNCLNNICGVRRFNNK